MISSYVKKQLAVFIALTVAAVVIIVFVYAHVPTALGFGRMTVTANFTNGAGIYPNANVTARGVGVGQITKVSLTPQGQVQATMSIDTATKIGADARAEIHSVSAVGEQYIDLITNQPGGPYLENGANIPVGRTSVPEQIAPVLDKTRQLLASIPNQGLQTFLDEGYKGFQNLGPDLLTLVTSAQDLVATADQNYAQTASLIRDFGPLFDTQNIAANDVRSYFKNLASFSGALRSADSGLRGTFRNVPAAADGVNFKLLRANENGAPILTRNLKTVGNVLGTYRNGVEQVFAAYPLAMAWEQIFANPAKGRGLHAAFGLNVYQSCTEGFNGQNLRNPEDLSDRDAEPNTFCKAPHNDPRLVRGARNLPCVEGNKGMRAGTVLECLGKVPYGSTSAAGGRGQGTQYPTLPVSPNTNASPGSGPLSPPNNQGNASSGMRDPLAAFGGAGEPDTGKGQTWQSLLTGPVGR